MTSAVLAPGYGGTAEQPLLRKLAARLEADDIATVRIAFSTKRPSRGYATEKQELRVARDEIVARAGAPVALVGRSFGGRMCTFLAAEEPPDALVILGHPIAPPDRPRPADEAALRGISCPTLVVQGDHDELGPLAGIGELNFVDLLPKTRSGKIMRRLLRDVAEQRPLGDTTTLADPSVVDELSTRAATEQADD